MKKLIIASTLLLLFSINVNAQSKSTSTQPKKALAHSKKEPTALEKGTKDVNDLNKYVGLNEAQKVEFTQIFEEKYSTLENESLSNERKEASARYMDSKIRTVLTEEQMRKLDKNPELLNRLTR